MKILVTYRLLGEDMPELTKEFESETEYEDWKSNQINILIISEIEIRSLKSEVPNGRV